MLYLHYVHMFGLEYFSSCLSICLVFPIRPAAPRHSLAEDGPAGSALHRIPGAPQGACQLHQNSGERHDPCRDDP